MDKTWNIYYSDDSNRLVQTEMSRVETLNFVSYCLGMGFEITGIIESEKD
jgi:hypothetical protein